MPRGIQERLLEAITEHGLGSREVAALVDLVREASVEEQARILRSPREVLAAAGKGKAPTEVRDPRLAEAGNQLLLELSRMERSCARVVSTVGVQGLSHLRRGDLLVLAPALGQAERAGQQASGTLREAISLAQGEQDADVHQP